MSWVLKKVVKKQVAKTIKSGTIVDVGEFGLTKSTCNLLALLQSISFGENYPDVKKIEVVTEWVDDYKVKVYAKHRLETDVSVVLEKGLGLFYVDSGVGRVTSIAKLPTSIFGKDCFNIKLKKFSYGRTFDYFANYRPESIIAINEIVKPFEILVNNFSIHKNYSYRKEDLSSNRIRWFYKDDVSTYNTDIHINEPYIEIAFKKGSFKGWHAISSGQETFEYPYDDTLTISDVTTTFEYERLCSESVFNLVIWEV